jgi:hypothetical protein
MSLLGAVNQLSGKLCLSPFLGCERLRSRTRRESAVEETRDEPRGPQEGGIQGPPNGSSWGA